MRLEHLGLDSPSQRPPGERAARVRHLEYPKADLLPAVLTDDGEADLEILKSEPPVRLGEDVLPGASRRDPLPNRSRIRA